MKRLKAKLALLMTFVFLFQSLTGVFVVTGTKAEAAGSLTLRVGIEDERGDYKQVEEIKGNPGETVTFKAELEGYKIRRISTNNPCEYKELSNGTYSFTFKEKDVELKFMTKAIRYKVRYYSNGGQGKSRQDLVRYGDDYIIPDNWYTYVGGSKEFCGFNTEKDGSGKSFKEGQTVKNLTTVGYEIVKLYAQWKEPDKSGKAAGSIFAGGNIGIWIGLAVIVSLLAVVGVIVVRRKKRG